MFWLVSGGHVGVFSKGLQDGRSIHFLLKMSNTHLPITLEQNAFGFKIWPRSVVLNPLKFHKHFGIEICYLLLLNFDMTSVETTNYSKAFRIFDI